MVKSIVVYIVKNGIVTIDNQDKFTVSKDEIVSVVDT